MIPRSYITQWKKNAPWNSDYQVEQDLIIERALIEIFSDEELYERLAFRGGTALHKLFLKPQARYSEDIDLVQVDAGSIGDILTLLREKLSFLGKAKYNLSNHNATLIYRFESEAEPISKLKLKIEINTREHFTVFGHKDYKHSVKSDWFNGDCRIKSFLIEELLSTKLRALYQRSKGRDLFDIYYTYINKNLESEKIIKGFYEYLKNENLNISKSDFISNMEAKLMNSEFTGDITALLRTSVDYNSVDAWKLVKNKLIDKLD